MMPGNAFGMQKAAALTRIGNGASWFLWIAGMSLINAVIAMTGSTWHFILGLGLTEVIDSFPTTPGGHAIAFGFDLVVAGVWVLFQWQAKQGKKWAFITGMTLYVLDALLLLIGSDYLSVAFHVYALVRIFPALAAISELRRIETAERQQASMASSQLGYASAPSGVWPPPPVAETPQLGAWPAPANAPQQGAWPANAPQQQGAWPPAAPTNAPQQGAWPPSAPSGAPQPGTWQPPAPDAPQPGVYPPPNR